MSISLTPSPHALPAAKPPSPVRPALKLAVRLNPDGAPLVLPHGGARGARRLSSSLNPCFHLIPRPLPAPRTDVRGYH